MRGELRYIRRQRLHELRRNAVNAWLQVSQPLRKALNRIMRHKLLDHSIEPLVTDYAPHVIHAHDLDTLPAGVTQARRLGIPLVYDAHEIPASKMPPKSWIEQAWIRYREKRNIGKADALITVGEGVANYYTNRYRLPSPTIIYNTPKLAPGIATPRDIRADCGLGPEVWLAVYVGNVMSGRGFETLLEALAQVPDMQLALLGRQRPQFESVITAAAKRLGLSGRLFRLPPVPPHEVVPYIGTASFGIFTIPDSCLNYRYAMPNKLFEMTFAGLPILGPRLADVTGYLEETGVGFVVDPEDAAAIAVGMRRMQADLARYKPDPARLKTIARKYGWEVQAKKLVELYARLLMGRRDRCSERLDSAAAAAMPPNAA